MKSENKDQYLETIGKGVLIVFIGIFVGKVFGYLIRIVMARFFGAADYGLFSLASALISVFTVVCLLGTNQGVARFIPFYRVRNQPENVKGVIISGLKIILPLSIILTIIVFFLSEIISVLVFQEPSLILMLQVFVIAIPFSVLLIYFAYCLRGFKQMKYVVLSEEIFKHILTFIFIITFFFIGIDILGAVFAHIVGFVAAVALAFYYIRKSFPDMGKIKAVSMKRKLISFSWPISIMGFLWIIVRSTDTIMLGFFSTSTQVGIYNIAMPTAYMLSLVITSFIYIFLPVMSELYSKKQDSEMKSIFESVSKWVFILTFPLFLLMLFFPDSIINLFFGQQYLQASTPLAILATGYLIFSVGKTANTSILAAGKTRINLLCSSMMTIVNVILNLIMIPWWGIIGAATATAISLVIFTASCMSFNYRYMKLRTVNKSYLRSVISGLISMLLIYTLARFAFGMLIPWWALFLLFAAFLLVYILLFMVFGGIDHNDLVVIKTLERRTGREFKTLKKIIKKFKRNHI